MKVLEEHAGRRVAWDVVIVFLVFATWIMVPLAAAFGVGPGGHAAALLFCIDLFFWADIILNHRTSYRSRGRDVTDPRLTAARYRRTLLPVDLAVNIPWDLPFALAGLPIATGLRFIRLLRIYRLFYIFRRWERMASTNSGYLRIIRFLLTITGSIHTVACLWFLQAAAAGFPAASWVARQGLAAAPAADAYLRSLYWAVTTMTTVGYGDIIPGTRTEYLIAALTMLLGASLYAFVIGNVAALFGNLDRRKSAYRNKTEAITAFLRNRHLPPGLLIRIRDYYDYLWERHNGWPNADFIRELPGALRLELMSTLTADLLENVGLFRYASPHLKRELLDALRLETHMPETQVVQAGERGHEICFISQGTMRIVPENGEGVVGYLKEGDSFGLLSLILDEKRTVSVYAQTHCEVFVLGRDDFFRIKREYPELTDVLQKTSTEKAGVNSDLLLREAVL